MPLDGNRCSASRPHAIARLGVGRTFQTPKLVAGSAWSRTSCSASTAGPGRWSTCSPCSGRAGASRPAREQALQLLARFGIADRAQDEAGALPLATQKIVEVARALISRPRLVLLDEPAAGPRRRGRGGHGRPAGGTRRREPTSRCVIIEHDLALVSRLCPRLAVLHQGGGDRPGHPGRGARPARGRRRLSGSGICCCRSVTSKPATAAPHVLRGVSLDVARRRDRRSCSAPTAPARPRPSGPSPVSSPTRAGRSPSTAGRSTGPAARRGPAAASATSRRAAASSPA